MFCNFLFIQTILLDRDDKNGDDDDASKGDTFHIYVITENQTYLLSVGIQIKPVKIKNTNTDTIEISPEKPLVFFSGQNYALLEPDNLGTRITGKGVIQ